MARLSKFMGVEYDIDKGFCNETHPALIHAPTRITQLQTRASDLEWNGQDASSIKQEIEHLKSHYEKTGQEYYPLF